jgi:hypothetical protein
MSDAKVGGHQRAAFVLKLSRQGGGGLIVRWSRFAEQPDGYQKGALSRRYRREAPASSTAAPGSNRTAIRISTSAAVYRVRTIASCGVVGSCVGKKPETAVFPRILAVSGGDGGIRTLDRALQPYNGLANRRLQPLGHVSTPADMPEVAQSRKRLDSVRSGTANCPGFPTFPLESSQPAGVLAAVAIAEPRHRGQERESSLTARGFLALPISSRGDEASFSSTETYEVIERGATTNLRHRYSHPRIALQSSNSFGARKIRVLATACRFCVP